MKKSRLLRIGVAVGCLVLFALGAQLIRLGFAEGHPAPVPTPEQEFSISPEDARDLDRAQADEPVDPPKTDLGPYVNLEPIEVPAPGNPADHLYIPSIHLSAPVVAQGVSARNVMSLPTDLRLVGWLNSTARLDAAQGSTLISGHVTYNGQNGAMYLLGRVSPGATIVTADSAAETTTWVVVSAKNYRKTTLPADLFEATGERRLVLVTCGGAVTQLPNGHWAYPDNIVITAVPA